MLERFFKEKIEITKAKKGINIPYPCDLYLVDLLKSFTKVDERLELAKEPFATNYLKFFQARDYMKMKNLADVILFTLGIFPESYSKSLVNQDYYITLGINAYKFVYIESRKMIFNKLASSFPLLVDILNYLSKDLGMKTDKYKRLILKVDETIH